MIDLSTKGVCIEDYNHEQVAIAVAAENSMTYRLNNEIPRWFISKYKGECIVNKNIKACDYLFLLEKENQKRVYLIELKGSDIHQGVLQIQSLLKFLKITKQSNIAAVHGRIVPSKYSAPNIRTNDYKRLKEVLKSLNGELKHKNRIFEENI